MPASIAIVVPPHLTTPLELQALLLPHATLALLAALGVLFLVLTWLWYQGLGETRRTAEWFLTAGRNMKSGIITASIVGCWTWTATLMVSSAEGYQHGIAGPYWYAAGATVPLLLFAIMAIYLKRRMPMVHTFGEFVWHRFGGPSHRLMVCLGLLTSVLVSVMVILGGAHALHALTGLEVQTSLLVIPLAFGLYSLLGGLRGSILIEALQVAVLLVIALVLTIGFWTFNGDLGIYERLRALAPREGANYLAMASLSALLFGVVNTIGNLGMVFLDQVYWQRAIAASDEAAGRSFLIGGLAWFAIPFGVGTALGVGGLALGLNVPFPYTDIAPSTAVATFGPMGAWLFLMMLFMVIISTGNAESIAASSLIATDVYKRYLRPDAGDAEILRVARLATLGFILLIGPACLGLHKLDIDMGWLYLAMGIFMSSGVLPLALGLLTDRLTGRGAFWATLGGLIVGLAVWVLSAEAISGAVTVESLGRLGPVTLGNLAVILTSGLICGMDCLRPHTSYSFESLCTAIRSYLVLPVSRSAEPVPQTETLSPPDRRLILWAIGISLFLDGIFPLGLYVSHVQFGPVFFAIWVILTLVWLMTAGGFVVLFPIMDYLQPSSPERLGLRTAKEQKRPSRLSIVTRLFLAFLIVVLTPGVGAMVSLVKLGSMEYLRGVNERILAEEALHEDLVFTLIPRALEKREKHLSDRSVSDLLTERAKVLASSPYTPSQLRALLGPSDSMPYLKFGEKEREILAAGISAAYRAAHLSNLQQISQERREAVMLILVSLIGTLAVGLYLMIRTSVSITNPVRRLAEASGRFSGGDVLVQQVPVETSDEIGELTNEFNAMSTRIREQMAALRAAEERFRLAAEAANDIIYDWSILEGTVELAAATKGLFGYAPGEIGRASDWWMERIHPEDQTGLNAKVRESIRLGHDFLGEYRLRRRDGTYALVLDHGVFINRDSGQSLRMVGTLKDITAEREMELQLRQAQKMEAIGLLGGGIAHDFNNLLTGILGNISLAYTNLETGHPVAQFLRQAEKAGRRAAELTRQLLTFGRRSAYQPALLHLPGHVEEAVALLRRTIDPRIEIQVIDTSSVWAVRADSTQIHQVLMNLCLNARDAMPEGGRMVVETANVIIDAPYCALHRDARPGQFVCLRVSDTGIGMDQETCNHIFDPFFTTKEVGKGTGLGLAMVYGIVKQHEGWMTVNSAPGQGTSFRIYLPALPKAAVEPQIGRHTPSVGPKGSERVLVVDDEESIRNFLSSCLTARGHTVVLASNGEEALKVFNESRERIELVILDLTMPKLNGYQVLRKLREQGHRVPVILSSGYSADGSIQDLIAPDKAQAFIPKPYAPDELLRTIRVVLDRA